MRSNLSTLFVPIRLRAWTWFWAIILFAYYALTMSRSLSLYDSPELALVAEQLGLGHPIGQPLHTMIGWAFSSVFSALGADPLIALNGLSAIAAALTLLPLCSMAESLLAKRDGVSDKHLRVFAPVVVLCGLHVNIWEPATRIEVYGLATFFALLGVARLMHVFLTPQPAIKSWWLTGLFFGLAASVHAHLAVACAIACAPRCLMAIWR